MSGDHGASNDRNADRGSDPDRDRAMDLTPTPTKGADGSGTSPAAYDPLRLCVFATVALLAWLGGPCALACFAGLGFVGYWRARRAGLLRSRCLLGDTRLVLVYLGGLVAVSGWGIFRQIAG